jgi:molybdopterin/thiamine biosynthesis adenylyltransferase/nitroreductase
MAAPFSFLAAFDRNIGWLTEWEQLALRAKRVAIAGMGGVGGFHLLTLARLGIGAFSIADLDHFEIANFNRQVGATMDTIGRPKVDVLAEMALAINPELKISRFENGVQDDNIDAFLAEADLFIDGFDFFALDIRRKVFRRCAELGIPALTAAPIGMGVGFIGFTPDGMDFEDYFRFEGQSELRQYVNFLLGMAPSGIHRAYLVDPGRLDFARKKAPSTIVGVQLAASVTASATVKLLLKRGTFRAAPYHHHYDAFLGKLVETHLRWGNAGPLQTLKARAAERAFEGLSRLPAKPEPRYPQEWREQIIDIARWTPSGDNAQPWRFRLAGSDGLVLFIQDESAENIYEYGEGQPTLLSAGMMLCSLQLAASGFSRGMQWEYQGKSGTQHRIAIQFPQGNAGGQDSLSGWIPLRSVDRRPYRLKALEKDQKAALASALGDELKIVWFEKWPERLKMAGLNAAATDIRLRIPETFQVHSRIIDWRRKQSPSGIPAGALGLDRATLSIMRWAMQDWKRLHRLNKFAGTAPARIQMDYLPGLFCAAHFSIQWNSLENPPDRTVHLLQAGMSLQRFWLTATRMGLAVQPSLAPLAFLHLASLDRPFTADRPMQRAGKKLRQRAARILPDGGADTVFMGRMGYPAKPSPVRSTRLPFEALILPADGPGL